MKPLDPAELEFRKRRGLHRSEPERSPERWVLVGLAIAICILLAIWYVTTRGDAAESEGMLARPDAGGFVSNAASDDRVIHQPESTHPAADIVVDARRWLSKCRAASGVDTFRTEGCVDGEQELARTHFVPDVASQAPMVASATDSSRYPGLSGQVAVIANTHQDASERSRCDMAKANRKAERVRLGMNVTYEGIQRLDEMVHQACK